MQRRLRPRTQQPDRIPLSIGPDTTRRVQPRGLGCLFLPRFSASLLCNVPKARACKEAAHALSTHRHIYSNLSLHNILPMPLPSPHTYGASNTITHELSEEHVGAFVTLRITKFVK